MQVRITDVKVEWVKKPGAKAAYGKASVEYDYNGSARKQNVMSFSNPDVFKKVQELVGQTVDVEVGKNDKDFTEWRSISVAGAASGQAGNSGSASTATATRVSGSNYETKEERARRQVLIVRQSSLTAALGTLAPGAKAALKPDEVMELAQDYVDWVLAEPKLGGESGFDDVDSDIPF